MNALHRSTTSSVLIAMLLPSALAHAQDQPDAAAARAAALESHILVAPEGVRWGNCPDVLPSGAQCAVIEGNPATEGALFALRLKMPDGYRIAPHFHSSDEHVLVVSGTFNVGMGDTLETSGGHSLPAGGFMAMPAGERHYAWTSGETVIHLYAIGPWSLTYVDPEDDPRKTAQQAAE